MQSLIDTERADAANKAEQRRLVARRLSSIPSRIEICRLHASATALNGTGEDLIGGEMYRLLPRATSIVMHPLHAKVAITIRRPVSWQGGQLMTL